ncbi:MAG TPA: cellulase family glycosylhydrolase [Galbitalea sp.]
MRIRAAALVVAIVAALTGFAQLGAVPASATVAVSPAPTPVVVGNRLVDSRTNTTFVPHGANWPSFEYACSQDWGYSQDGDTDAAAHAMATWGINAVRIPLNENCWLGSDSKDWGTAAGYQAAVNAWVNILNAHGIVAILDLHWSAPPGQHALGQWPMADSQSTKFWTSVATAYASDPSVMFDAFNEPYSIWNDTTNSYTFQLTWDCWENGGCQAPLVTTDQVPVTGSGAGTYTVVGMSALVAAIRAGNAKQPIMLGGIDYSNNLSGWLAHKPNDSQLIASWHNYQDQSPCGNTAACWTSEVGSVAAVVPVVTGEFGETDGTADFMNTFMTWADANGIGYLPWAWWDANDVSGDAALYALYAGPNFTANAPTGTAYKAHLASIGAAPASTYITMPAPMNLPPLQTSSAPTTTVAPMSSTPAEVPAVGIADLTTDRYLRIARP